ncbi:MAG TPA: hypothetical protein PLO37_09455 [Candidatus Hydrogenedentes bacterium]|nr:hypothetical protein [Candidatus Hydrogenedentota bacterium]HPG67057.1 hypothetical protein [Candidatus Hydrogenedentota bacterium]
MATLDTPGKPPRPIRHRYAFDAACMAVYTLIVYGCALSVYPLGRDYAAMADPDAMPFLANRLFAAELDAFGTHAVPYHLVNLTLLLGCMIAIYHLTRFTLRGPHWYGTLAATLFMANPVHAEAVLNLSGPADLVPALAAILAVTVYAAPPSRRAQPWRWFMSVALFAWATIPYRQNVGLIVVLALFEWLARVPDERRMTRLAPFLATAVVACVLHVDLWHADHLDIAALFGPLYLVFYPIGLLPETAAALHASPWLAGLSALTVVVAVVLMYRKARRPAILFGLFGMAATRLFQGSDTIDPVHMVGGGALLTATALFYVASAALFYRIAEHPKWRQPIIVGTALLCVVFFALEVRANLAWRHAGHVVRSFQAEVAEVEGPVAVLPDYQYYLGAPMCVSESVRYDTPFSRAASVVPIVLMHYAKPADLRVRVGGHVRKGALSVLVEGKRPVEVMPWPYAVLGEGDAWPARADVLATLDHVDRDGFVIEARPTRGTFPETKIMP